MKSFNILKIIINLSLFLCISLITHAKTGSIYGTDMPDTLIAGDTAIIRITSAGYWEPAELAAELWPLDFHDHEFCPECSNDSIRSYRIEQYNDTLFDLYFAIPLGTYPGKYNLVVYLKYDGSLLRYDLNFRIYSPPYIFRHPVDKIVCRGDSAKFEVRALGDYEGGLGYSWYHNDILHLVSNWRTLGLADIQLKDTGLYYCIISNWFGKDTSSVVRLDLYPSPASSGPPEGPDRFCPGTENTAYSIKSDPYVMNYIWHLFPEIAGNFASQDTSADIDWDPGYTGIAGIFVTLMSNYCGGVPSDTLEITIPGPSTSPGICIVGIDEESGKYNIVWEKSGYEDSQLFKIYRESNQADVYLEIGTVNPDEFSVFVDPASAPDILSHRYKISYTDSCGNESELSAFHQTMHLSANLSLSNDVNLIWSEYKGIAFPTYQIYRGNRPDSLTLLTQVPSTVTAYKDTDPPSGILWYQIGMSNPDGCQPDKKAGVNFSSSRSNMEQVQNTSVPDIIFGNKPFMIFPNPAEKEIYFRFSKTYTDPLLYKIYNFAGINILEGLFHPGKNSIDISSLPAGIFVIELCIENKVFKTRFIHF